MASPTNISFARLPVMMTRMALVSCAPAWKVVMITTFRAGAQKTNAIRVIITGNRAKEMFVGEAIRYASIDGDLADLDSGAPADLVPWISSNWGQSFKWRGSGAIPEADQRKLKDIVA